MTSCNPVPVAQPGKGGVGMEHTSEPKQLTFPQVLSRSRDLCRLLAEPSRPDHSQGGCRKSLECNGGALTLVGWVTGCIPSPV